MLDFPNQTANVRGSALEPFPQIRIDRTFKGCWREGLPAEEYHADKATVSSTTLKTILKSPASFLTRYLGPSMEPTPAMAFGTLVHHAILEGADFVSRYVVQPDFGDMRSSKNREARDAWKTELPEIAVVVTAEQRDQIKGIVEAVYSHRDACALLDAGKAEVSGYFADPDTGILLRIRPDCFHAGLPGNIDIKTAENGSREAFQKAIVNFGYHFQMAMYCEGIAAIGGKKVEYPAWIVPETKPPYEVSVFVADDEMMEKGRTEYRKALTLLECALKNNHWPRRQSAAEDISLPRWALD